MMLKGLVERIIQANAIPVKRIPPLRTSAKHFAACLGTTPEHCPQERYDLSDDDLSNLLTARALPKLGPDALRNVRHDARTLLRLGRTHGWLPPRIDARTCLQARRKVPGHQDVIPHEGWTSKHYGLYPLQAHAPILAKELEEYLKWCQRPVARHADGTPRPKSIRKRPGSCDDIRYGLAQIAGYAVTEAGYVAETLTLAMVTNPALVGDWLEWWTERRGKLTVTATRRLAHLRTIAKYWLKDTEHTQGITDLMRGCTPEKVRNKEDRMLSLSELHHIAQIAYPFTDARKAQSYYIRAIAEEIQQPGRHPFLRGKSLARVAWELEASLLLQLLLERPWRQRQYREACLGVHLVQRPDRQWQWQFRGKDLKIERRNGQENELSAIVPPDIQPRLEEWLTVWRPRLCPSPQESHVFLNRAGKPFTRNGITRLVETITWRYSGVAVTPHMFRDIFATEYLNENPGDAAGVARRLGNTVPTVYRHYAHLLNASADARADSWLRSKRG
jgi:hypothetical protein